MNIKIMNNNMNILNMKEIKKSYCIIMVLFKNQESIKVLMIMNKIKLIRN